MQNSAVEGKIIKSVICPECKKRLNFKVNIQDLEQMKDGQLFNFSLMHSDHHTLVVAIDVRGEIRRSRVSIIHNVETYEDKIAPAHTDIGTIINHKKITNIDIEDCNNLQDAFAKFLQVQN